MEQRIVYSEDEWRESVADRPLRDVAPEQLLLLHRHWVWANFQRDHFDQALLAGEERPAHDLVGPVPTAMFLWYALLWSVIEAFDERSIELGGRFAEDIASMSDGLRRCRNAVFHVSRDAYYDARLSEFMGPDAAFKIRRISSGFGRLFLEEVEQRRIQPE